MRGVKTGKSKDTYSSWVFLMDLEKIYEEQPLVDQKLSLVFNDYQGRPNVEILSCGEQEPRLLG